MVKDFSAWANAWSDYSRSDVNYLVFVVGGTAALVVLALSLLLESNCTVLTFFCGLAVVVTLAGIWVVNFYPIWMEDSPEPAVFTTQVEKEFGVRNLSCSPAVMSTKDASARCGHLSVHHHRQQGRIGRKRREAHRDGGQQGRTLRR